MELSLRSHLCSASRALTEVNDYDNEAAFEKGDLDLEHDDD
jgi:hypothetical protein